MFFFNGLTNIKNILVISFLFFLSLSTIILSDYIKKWSTELEAKQAYNNRIHKSEIYFNCDINFINFNFEDSIEYFQLDDPITKEQILKQLKNICEKIDFNQDTSDIYYFELDSLSYLKSLNKLLLIDKLIKEIEDKHNVQGINQIIIDRSVNLQRYIISGEYNLLSDHEKQIFILNFFKETNIQQIKTVKIFAAIYKQLFEDIKYVGLFIIIINLIILASSIFLLSLILKFLFQNLSNSLTLLISLNIFFQPIFIIYYLSFYKEPIILLSFLILIYNYLFFYFNKESLKIFIILNFFVFLSFILMATTKYELILVFFFSQITAFTFLIIKKKNFFIFLHFLQIIAIGFYIYYPNYISNVFYSKIYKNEISEFLTSRGKEKNNFVEKEIIKLNSEKKFKDNLNDKFFSKPQEVMFLNDNFEDLKCNELFNKFCKKLNNFMFKISAMKIATLHENFFYSKNSKNINNINGYEYRSTVDVLKQIPFSIIKGLYMPVLFNSKKITIIISLFKLTLFILLILIFFHLFIDKKYSQLFLLASVIILFSPLLLATDLVTSNFYTYFRYTFPYNIVLCSLISSYYISKISFK